MSPARASTVAGVFPADAPLGCMREVTRAVAWRRRLPSGRSSTVMPPARISSFPERSRASRS